MNKEIIDNCVETEEGKSLVDRYTVSKKRKKIIAIVILCIVILAAVLFVSSRFTKKSGYEGAVDEFMDAYEKGDVSTVVEDMMSGYFTARKLSGISIVDTVSYFMGVVANAHQGFENSLGEEYDISYEITSANVMRREEYDAMVKSLTFGGFNASNVISEAVRVEVTVTAEADDTSATHVFTLLLTNEDGNWLILDIK